MTEQHTQLPEQAAPYILTDVQHAAIAQVAPTLRVLNDKRQIIDGVLSPDHADFPGHVVQVGAYYMNHTDPTSVGAWRINVGEKGNLAMTATLWSSDTGGYSFKVRNPETKGYEPANERQAAQLVDLLSMLPRVKTPATHRSAERAARHPSWNRFVHCVGSVVFGA